MSVPLSISFYVPPPTPTPLPPHRPSFLNNPTLQGVDLLSLLTAPAGSDAEAQQEAQAALANAGCEAKEVREVVKRIEEKTQMACFRAMLLEDRTTILLQLEGGMKYHLALHGTSPSPNSSIKPVLSSAGWEEAGRSPSLSPERARAGDSGVAFGGERVSKGETELKWALFEAPTQMQKMQGRGRALFRKT